MGFGVFKIEKKTNSFRWPKDICQSILEQKIYENLKAKCSCVAKCSKRSNLSKKTNLKIKIKILKGKNRFGEIK